MVAAVLMQAVIIWLILGRLQATDRANDEARTELFHYAAVADAVADQETGLRGYLLSHQPQFLARYEDGRRRFENEVSPLRAVSADDPPSMRSRVEEIIAARQAWDQVVASPLISAIKSGQTNDGVVDLGDRYLGAIRSNLIHLRQQEMDLLDHRDHLRNDALSMGRLTLLVGSSAALLFACALAWRSLQRFVVQQNAAREAADRIADALDHAHAAERAKTTFLANMSHEMRTPLNGILGMAQALELTSMDGPERNMVAVIRNSGEALDHLIGDLLALARGEISPTEADESAFELGGLMRAAGTEHRKSAEMKGIDLAVSIGPGVAGVVRGDGARLRQLIGCLLSNAVKFTERGGIEVAATALGGDLYRLSVIDTGIGFDEARLDELFGGFSQADESATRQYSGAGLGLALASRLARELGSSLRAHSRIGKGSEFTLDVRLPAAVREPRSPISAAA